MSRIRNCHDLNDKTLTGRFIRNIRSAHSIVLIPVKSFGCSSHQTSDLSVCCDVLGFSYTTIINRDRTTEILADDVRLVCTDRKATLTQTTARYSRAELKSISECTTLRWMGYRSTKPGSARVRQGLSRHTIFKKGQLKVRKRPGD